ncbi:HEAT repeat domain-containing protein [Micromonospora sp. NBC_01699]|uniref:HEAT repeat domain-containing protein n=1 Tax=Micromonospora sp. NBC_01699 TaxID=2975984 RepID=UPI002E3295FD|nr:HEAT repeat domain-containing protein [Micromonospora sp. NBC_01699]
MLSGLDDVPWDELHHAFGKATDVPGLLRGVADGDDDALGDLFGNIWHQGTVYEATAYAVPFLVELLDAPGTDTTGLLGLLAAIAQGTSYADVHQDYEPATVRDSPELSARIEQELAWTRAARTAVAAGAPIYLRLLTTAPEEEVRGDAAYTLRASIEPTDPAASVMLHRIGREDSPLVRAGLILAAGGLGTATPPLITGWLGDPAAPPRLAAALVAVHLATESAIPLPDGVEAVLERDTPSSLDALSTLPWSALGDDPLRWVIEQLADQWELRIRLLRGWMRHDSADVRKGAVFAAEHPILEWRPAATELGPALAARLSDPDRDVRYWAASLLADSGHAAATAADELWALVRREPVRQNEPAAFALVALCRLHDPRAATYLAERLAADPVDLSGLDAAIRLVGPWADACRVPLVRFAPLAPAGNNRISLISAIGRLYAGTGAPAGEVVPLLRQECVSHPHIATRVLGDLGPDAVDALPDLHPMLAHDDPFVRVNAARAVWRIGADPAPALPVLREILVDGGRADRGHAVDLLPELGPAAVELADLLPPWFGADDDSLAVGSAVAYWHLTGDPTTVVPALLPHLRTGPDGRVALACLADIGPAARAAVPVLRAAVEQERHGPTGGGSPVDEDEDWPTACAGALARIDVPPAG